MFNLFRKKKITNSFDTYNGLGLDGPKSEDMQVLGEIYASLLGRAKENGGVYLAISALNHEYEQGFTKLLSYIVHKSCNCCNGTGEATRGSSEQCFDCNGAGGLLRTEGTPLGKMEFIASCEKCNGKGYIIKSPCAQCNAKGLIEMQEEQEVTVSANFAEQPIVYPGKGHYINDNLRGPLIVTVGIEGAIS